MANKFDVIYANKQSGKRERCTLEEWDKIKSHPTLGRAFVLIKKEVVPQAAVEAHEAKDEQEQEAQPASTKPKKRRRN